MQGRRDLRLEPAPAVKVEMSTAFADSCLPNTMELARLLKRYILPRLGTATKLYRFEDRALFWLAPYWEKEVKTYYTSAGADMVSSYDSHQLQRFDEHYQQKLRDLLG